MVRGVLYRDGKFRVDSTLSDRSVGPWAGFRGRRSCSAGIPIHGIHIKFFSIFTGFFSILTGFFSIPDFIPDFSPF